MKSIMLSIQPKYCELIANGKKTIEVRKTKPKLDAPFKCYIYCTNQGRPLVYGSPCPSYVDENLVQTYGYSKEKAEEIFGCWNGKVIGEFICDEILQYKLADVSTDVGIFYYYERYCTETNYEVNSLNDCLNDNELLSYGNYNNFLYGWHISNLVIYDTPKELRMFNHPCIHEPYCVDCKYSLNEARFCYDESVGCDRHFRRPPQSWCYVEELGGENK